MTINPEAMNTRGIVDYNIALNERAREMRKNPTEAELYLWVNFLKARPEGCKFIRQKPLSNYIVDFYCSSKSLVIEVDGDIHDSRQKYDADRDDYLRSCGFTILRFRNEAVLHEFEDVKASIASCLQPSPP